MTNQIIAILVPYISETNPFETAIQQSVDLCLSKFLTSKGYKIIYVDASRKIDIVIKEIIILNPTLVYVDFYTDYNYLDIWTLLDIFKIKRTGGNISVAKIANDKEYFRQFLQIIDYEYLNPLFGENVKNFPCIMKYTNSAGSDGTCIINSANELKKIFH